MGERGRESKRDFTFTFFILFNCLIVTQVRAETNPLTKRVSIISAIFVLSLLNGVVERLLKSYRMFMMGDMNGKVTTGEEIDVIGGEFGEPEVNVNESSLICVKRIMCMCVALISSINRCTELTGYVKVS